MRKLLLIMVASLAAAIAACGPATPSPSGGLTSPSGLESPSSVPSDSGLESPSVVPSDSGLESPSPSAT